MRPLSLLVLVAAAAGCFRAPPPRYPAADRLAALMADRLALMGDVARAKWNTKAPVADPKREDEFLREMAAAGGELGLDPKATTAFFAGQIEAAKLVQDREFLNWRSANQGKFPNAPDLARDLRPRIDRVSRDLLAALAEYRAADPPPAYQLRWIADERLAGPLVTREVRAAALRPLLDAAP